MSATPQVKSIKWLNLFFEAGLILLIAFGIGLRFSWTNWSQGTNLHPDEYGLTSTLVQLHLPRSLGEYFNTRLSPLSPYNKYDSQGLHTADGPDNRMRWGQWPITLIRTAGELTGNTGYDEIRLLGRRLSALADTLSILILFLIGARLYNHKTGLLAATLSALAVLQIQQSHFMTVDNFGLLFSILAMYAAVRVAQRPSACLPNPAVSRPSASYRPDLQALGWFALFGVSLGMAAASKINLAPLGGMLLPAAFLGVADLKLRTQKDLPRIFAIAALYLVFAGLVSLITFRVTQPMSFRALTGDTSVLTLQPNPDWGDSMKVAESESNGIGGGPPGEQWAQRTPLVFPLTNMVMWGLGLPLGLMGWLGFFMAAGELLWTGKNWKSHLLPLAWTAGFFIFMGTRWVMSIRYFLPIYLFLVLFAAWGLLAIWRWAFPGFQAEIGPQEFHNFRPSRIARRTLALIAMCVVLLGTLGWAIAFTNAIYRQDVTRIRATEWIFQNIPAPFQLAIQGPTGTVYAPISAPDRLGISLNAPYHQSFTAPASGKLSGVVVPHAFTLQGPAHLQVVVSLDQDGKQIVGEAQLTLGSPEGGYPGDQIQAGFQGGSLQKGQTYFLVASSLDSAAIEIDRSVIANESWDEGLPVPFDNLDPFGQLYRGLTMETRWNDDANKKRMFIEVLSESDYLVLPSQRSIWSSCRIPLTYPMTMAYYRALFSGKLGFDLAASFTAPMKLGPLEISDVGGTFAWNQTPRLPLFNNNPLAAEEAFSVYDHPPVWIFKKNSSFNIQAVEDILNSVDLTKVVVQGPRDATGQPCQP